VQKYLVEKIKMNPNIQSTSLSAYETIKPELGDRQSTVYAYILEHPGLLANEIAQGLNLPINCVTGRIRELANMNLICSVGIRASKITGFNGLMWEAVKKEIQQELF